MSRTVRALQHLLPLSLGSLVGLIVTPWVVPALHAASLTPTVTLTAPSNGSTVSGTVSVWAAASDVGFAGIQFQADGVNLGSEITAGSCDVNWDTAGAPEGSHTLTAIARDDSGNLTSATPITVTIINSAPVISGVTAWNISDTSASITWNTNQSTDGTVSDGLSSSYGTNSTDSSMATAHTIALSNLTAGTAYHYSIQAWNALGMSSTTSDLTFTTTGGAAPPTPVAPVISGITVSDIGISSAFVNWNTDLASSGSVDFGTSTGYGSTTTDSTPATSHTILLSGLAGSTTYHFRVDATSVQSMSSASGDFSFTTTAAPPAPPTPTPPQISGVTAWNITDSSVSITWNTSQSTTGSADIGTTLSYGGTSTDSTMATSHTLVFSNLSSGTTYHYRVHATNAQSLSSASGDLTFDTTSSVSTPPPSTPPPPSNPTPPSNPAPPSDPTPSPSPAPAPPTTPEPSAKPTVAITSPLQSESFGIPAKVMVSAKASEANGTIASVAFYVNGTLIGTSTTLPYTLSWVSWTTGTYSLVAVATDGRGATTASNAVSFRVEDRAGTLHSLCALSDPFAEIGGGSCLNGTWVPPGYTPASNGVTALAILDGGQPTGGCTTKDPYTALGGGTCIGGGWLPPGVATSQTGFSENGLPATCSGADPFSGTKGLIGVCLRGTWLPAISGRIGG